MSAQVQALTSAFARVDPTIQAPPTESERYVILRKLGAGGCGEVFLAYDAELDRKVALKKILHRHLDSDGEALLIQEARLLAKLRHPNIVTVFDIQELPAESRQESLCIIMEYVEGLSLRDWLSAKPRSRRQILQVFQQAGRGLEAAHAAGIYHRDFKLDNVLIEGDDCARVLDFGLSQLATSKNEDALAITRDATLEATSLPLMGTPAYMAPERFLNPDGSVASDIFSFAVSLWEALLGHRPFSGDSIPELQANISSTHIAIAPNPRRLNRHLNRVLRRALAPDPEQRYPSMEALLTDLAYNPRARWGRGIGMLSLVAGAATVGSLFSSPEVAPACQGIGQTFATHWNEARSQALGKVILTTKTPFAATTWERIRPRIDAYAQEIRTAAQQACEDTKAHSHVADLRLACLHRCEVELDALVEALQTGGSKSIQRAIRATDALTPISSCDESVLTAQRTAPPRDAAVASAVELLRADLARIKAMRIAGRPREVFETAAAAVERAKELGYLPALAEAHLEHAELYASIIDLKTAEPEYEAAWHAALASDHDRVARDAANFLAGELAYEPPRLGEAKVWIAHADAVALRMGVNDEHTYFNQAALGRVAETEGRFADAIAPMKEAARAGEAAFGPNSWEVISVHAVLSSVLGRSGDLDAATVEIERAVEAAHATFGTDHPALYNSYRQQGILLAARGEREKSIEVMYRVVALAEPAYGPKSRPLAAGLNSLGYELCQFGNYEEGLKHLDRALAIETEHVKPEAFEYLLLRHNRALCLLGLQRSEEARTVFQENLATGLRTLGENHLFLATTHLALAKLASTQKHFDAAETHHQRVLEIRQSHFGADHRELAPPLVGLAEVSLHRGQRQQALALAERALEVLAKEQGNLEALAPVRFALARALGPTPGEQTRAKELAEQAREGFKLAGTRQAQALAQVEAWLASP